MRPYFPPGHYEQFLYVHFVFTNNHVERWIAQRPTEQQRQDMVTGLIWEAAQRRLDPVGVSHAIYEAQRQQIVALNNLVAVMGVMIQHLTNQQP
jgi:hypothetical protein